MALLQQHCTFEVDINSQIVYFKNLLNAGYKNMLEQKKVILNSFVDKYMRKLSKNVCRSMSLNTTEHKLSQIKTSTTD